MAARSSYRNPSTNGPAAAALLASGIGSAAMGIVTILAETSGRTAIFLSQVKLVGPLSGRLGIGIFLYLVSWLGFGFIWKGKNVNFSRAAAVAFFLLVIGLLGTCPPVSALIAGK